MGSEAGWCQQGIEAAAVGQQSREAAAVVAVAAIRMQHAAGASTAAMQAAAAGSAEEAGAAAAAAEAAAAAAAAVMHAIAADQLTFTNASCIAGLRPMSISFAATISFRYSARYTVALHGGERCGTPTAGAREWGVNPCRAAVLASCVHVQQMCHNLSLQPRLQPCTGPDPADHHPPAMLSPGAAANLLQPAIGPSEVSYLTHINHTFLRPQGQRHGWDKARVVGTSCSVSALAASQAELN